MAPTVGVLITARVLQRGAGALVTPGSWRWIFALNVPLVLVTLSLILAAVPVTAPRSGRRVDLLGAGLAALGFKSGLTTLPVTLVMFALSRRFGAIADRMGPRLFMAAGPLLAAAGILLLLRVGMHVSYLTGLLPALLVFAIVICAGLVAAGGITGAFGIVNPRRTVPAMRSPGGQLVGTPQPALPQGAS